MFKMNNCIPTITPMEIDIKLKMDTNDEFEDATLNKKIIDSLKYICNIRPDIFESVDLVSSFMEKSRSWYLLAAKRILRHIEGTIDHGVLIPKHHNTRKEVKVYAYSDFILGMRSRWQKKFNRVFVNDLRNSNIMKLK